MYYVFELEGTLSSTTERKGRIRYNHVSEYESSILRDSVVVHIKELILALLNTGYRVEVWTFRKETFRDVNERWLAKNGLSAVVLRMRQDHEIIRWRHLRRHWVFSEQLKGNKPDIYFSNGVVIYKEFKAGFLEKNFGTFMALHGSGLSPKHIGKALKVSSNTIVSYYTRLGLSPNGWRRKSLNLQPNGMAICSKCDELKPLNRFFKNGLSFCRDCDVAKKRNRKYSSPALRLRKKECHILAQSKRRNIEYNLPEHYLLTLWEEQDGKCFYTKIDMVTDNPRDPHVVSVDKVIPEKGYTVGNVVLCSRKINIMKSNATLDELELWIPVWRECIREKFGI